MLRFVYEEPNGHGAVTRREWLRLSGLASLGCALTPTLAAGKPLTPGFGRAKAAILIFANGGQSHLDTWDPKPEAPAEVRGEFQSIETTTPGVRVCEHLPRVAQQADKLTIVRGMSHDDLDHGSAAYLAFTGQFHPRKSSNPPPRPTDYPTYGAVLKRVRPNKQFPYTAVYVNGPAIVPQLVAPGQSGGFLGREFEPLVIGDVTATRVALPSLAPRDDVPTVRLDGRRGLLESLDGFRRVGEDRRTQGIDVLYRRAFEVLASSKCREAFNLNAEPPALRERYGRYRSGQACLLARRLVEAGVPLVTVMFNHCNRGQDSQPGVTDAYGWDTHNDIFDSLRNRLLPRFDQSFSALLEDLHQRGLLEDTLVICFGEFGRAPRVALEPKFAGSSPGRKHWASAYSIVMAGAGVKAGAVHGETDAIGGEVLDSPVRPGDLVATLFASLGVNPAGHYRDMVDRPFPIATGRPIAELF